METYLLMMKNGKRICFSAESAQVALRDNGALAAMQIDGMDIEHRHPIFVDPNEIAAIEVLKGSKSVDMGE